jgi:pimeloyl-ACP methyl ester carboxylesterase
VLVLFVHGALVRDADWWWHRMPGPLAGHGLRTAAVELPSCVGRGDLAADATAVAAAVRAAGEPVTLVGHSTYLVCTQDQAIPAETQRAAAVRAERTVEIPTGHHPFLSRPDLFAETLAGTIRTSATLPP